MPHTAEGEGANKARGQNLGSTVSPLTGSSQGTVRLGLRLPGLLPHFAITERVKSQQHLRREFTMLGTGAGQKEDPSITCLFFDDTHGPLLILLFI